MAALDGLEDGHERTRTACACASPQPQNHPGDGSRAAVVWAARWSKAVAWVRRAGGKERAAVDEEDERDAALLQQVVGPRRAVGAAGCHQRLHRGELARLRRGAPRQQRAEDALAPGGG